MDFLSFICAYDYPARNNISQYDLQVGVVCLNIVLYSGRLDMKGNDIYNFLGISLKLKALFWTSCVLSLTERMVRNIETILDPVIHILP